MTQRRLWSPEEDQIIINLVKQHGTKKWTTVADEMKKLMNQYSRTSKQIRQRWHNHLDPSVSKKQWSKKQESILFQSHRLMGSKWKQIANKLEGRTDNHVKNYFYSTMRRALRRVNKFLGSKNSTTQMRTVRPSILSYLLDISDTDTEIRSLVANILEFSKFKPRKTSGDLIFKQKQKQTFQTAINKLMQINEIYSKKGNRKLKQIEQLKIQQKTQYSHEHSYQQSLQIKQEEGEGEGEGEGYGQKQEGGEVEENQKDQQSQEEEEEEKSWQDQNVESYNCQMMPEIQKPDYQCDLLTKKEDSIVPSQHVQSCLMYQFWGVGANADTVFQF